MTVLKFGGKLEKKAYQASGGLHGLGDRREFLPQWCEVEVHREGKVSTRNQMKEEFRLGQCAKPVRRRVAEPKPRSKPDGQIFANTKYAYKLWSSDCKTLRF